MKIIENKKEYSKQWYLNNKDRIKKKMSAYYYEHREQKLLYARSRRNKDNILKKKRYYVPSKREKILNNQSLWVHKNCQKIYKKRQIEQQIKYLEYQEITKSSKYKHPWAVEEYQYLKDNYKKNTIVALALHLDRTYAATGHQLYKLGLIKTSKRITKLLDQEHRKKDGETSL